MNEFDRQFNFDAYRDDDENVMYSILSGRLNPKYRDDKEDNDYEIEEDEEYDDDEDEDEDEDYEEDEDLDDDLDDDDRW